MPASGNACCFLCHKACKAIRVMPMNTTSPNERIVSNKKQLLFIRYDPFIRTRGIHRHNPNGFTSFVAKKTASVARCWHVLDRVKKLSGGQSMVKPDLI